MTPPEYKLCYYFDRTIGPFKNLSALSDEEADRVMAGIRKEGSAFSSKRSEDYLVIRRQLERRARTIFTEKGGRPASPYPHYLTLAPCRWLETWFAEPAMLEIDWDYFSQEVMSFTYGDLFPAMRYADARPYRNQVYTKREIMDVIERHGLPQRWNPAGAHGPERYIEVQIWDDAAIQAFLKGDWHVRA